MKPKVRPGESPIEWAERVMSEKGKKLKTRKAVWPKEGTIGWVDSQLFWRFVDRAYPDLTGKELAERLGKDDGNIYRYKKSMRMTFEVADEILSELGLNYLLSTGDIPVYNSIKEFECRTAPSVSES